MVENPFADLSLLKWDGTSFTHCSAALSPTLLGRIYIEHLGWWDSGPGLSCHRFSIRFWSRPCPNHAKIFTELFLSHSWYLGKCPIKFGKGLQKVLLRCCVEFISSHSPFNSKRFPSSCRWEVSPHHDVTTAIFHNWYGVSWGMDSVRCMQLVAFPTS